MFENPFVHPIVENYRQWDAPWRTTDKEDHWTTHRMLAIPWDIPYDA